MASVTLTDVIRKMEITNLTPEIDTDAIRIKEPDVNRPAIQLYGYFEHFEPSRIQIIGFVEHSYMQTLTPEQKEESYAHFLSAGIPCVVFCREFKPDEVFLAHARANNVPLLLSRRSTSTFMAELIRWLNVELAPRISIHGVLVDIYGEGVLITGESGIGKSEAALELIKRGHRLVSDDVVEIRRVSEQTLIGTAPDVTRHFIEVRGIGIIDVKELFGVTSVRDTATIDLVIQLEEWDKEKVYNRVGLEEETIEYLGNRVVCHSIPIRPGRNVAVICESAAANHRLKKMGYNATEELYKRVQRSLTRPGRGGEEG